MRARAGARAGRRRRCAWGSPVAIPGGDLFYPHARRRRRGPLEARARTRAVPAMRPGSMSWRAVPTRLRALRRGFARLEAVVEDRFRVRHEREERTARDAAVGPVGEDAEQRAGGAVVAAHAIAGEHEQAAVGRDG